MVQAYRGQIMQAANKQRAGIKVDDKAAGSISSLRVRLVENKASLDNLKIREEEIRAEFGKQVDRYRFLEEEWAKESAEG
jgi:hypothetical protein